MCTTENACLCLMCTELYTGIILCPAKLMQRILLNTAIFVNTSEY